MAAEATLLSSAVCQLTRCETFRNGGQCRPSVLESSLSSCSTARRGDERGNSCSVCSNLLNDSQEGGRFTSSHSIRVSRLNGLQKKSSRSTPFATRTEDAAGIEASHDESPELSFLEKLAKAWSILFPPKARDPSAAEIARERLRLVLYTDRCDVSPEIRKKLRENILKAISTYVEIESEEEVRLNVSKDPDLGSVYSVTVPVRRVKPEFQEAWGEGGFRDRVWTLPEEQMKRAGVRGAYGTTQPSIRLETRVLRSDETGQDGSAGSGPWRRWER
eukprot:TRINITY_DN18479_c0_g1_i1.p1 TRINITY_DN18479_c0_g1~~TRINITY_DN18479_c0_g1_i1.p1  ORF type:complete len:275 (+),score=26.71 TRINITY_DN18479_c0_g1_i1:42-866(+)